MCTIIILDIERDWPEQTDPDQTLQNVATEQGLHCLPLIQQHFRNNNRQCDRFLQA